MAMTLQSSGVPREMIGQVMGHKDLSTTNTYLDSFGDAEIEKVTLKSLYNNKELKFIATTTRKSKSGYISKAKIYECENCNDCPIKSKCTKAKGNKRIQVSPVFITKRKQSQDNITSEFGILARMNRSIQVEGAFGVIKENHNFRRFLTRGKKNVKVEFLLLALAYNLNKLHHKIQQNRLGVSFYTKAIA